MQFFWKFHIFFLSLFQKIIVRILILIILVQSIRNYILSTYALYEYNWVQKALSKIFLKLHNIIIMVVRKMYDWFLTFFSVSSFRISQIGQNLSKISYRQKTRKLLFKALLLHWKVFSEKKKYIAVKHKTNKSFAPRRNLKFTENIVETFICI